MCCPRLLADDEALQTFQPRQEDRVVVSALVIYQSGGTVTDKVHGIVFKNQHSGQPSEVERLRNENDVLQERIRFLEQSFNTRMKYLPVATPQSIRINKPRLGLKVQKSSRAQSIWPDPSDTTVNSNSEVTSAPKGKDGPEDRVVKHISHKLAHLAMIKAGCFPSHVYESCPGRERTVSVCDVVTATMDQLAKIGITIDWNGTIDLISELHALI